MTRDEFLALPARTALGVIYDALHSTVVTLPAPPATAATTTSSAPAPRQQSGDGGRAPKYDGRLSRKGGFVFMSEMLLADLAWWREKKRESVNSGSQYAAKDAKTLAELERWIVWRAACPGEAWRGTRGDRQVTAEPPSREPTIHEWPDRAPARLAPPPPTGGYSDADYGAGGVDDEIPF